MSKMLKRNPFDTKFGNIPQLYLDLDEDIRRYVRRAHRLGMHPVYCLFITGVYGSGKTVFMKQLAKVLVKYSDTVVITLHHTEDLFRSIYSQLVSLMPKLKSQENSGTHNDIYYNYEIDKILNLLKQVDMRVIFCISDVTNTSAVRELAESFNEWSLNNFQVSIIMTGSPKNVNELWMADNLTFLVRSDRFKMPILRRSSMSQTYQKAFGFKSSQLAEKMADLTQGYAYAFQLLGYQTYQSMNKVPDPKVAFEKAKSTFKDILFKRSYSIIIQEVNKTDLEFLSALAQDNSLDSIIKQMHQNQQEVNACRIKLTNYGLIQPQGNGRLGFTLPMFQEFVLTKNKKS